MEVKLDLNYWSLVAHTDSSLGWEADVLNGEVLLLNSHCSEGEVLLVDFNWSS